MASVGNPTSFWLTEESLLKLLDSCGYRSIDIVEPSYVSKYGTPTVLRPQRRKLR